MKEEQLDMETENVFELSILLPLIKMLEVYMSSNRLLSPDEFCVALYMQKHVERSFISKKYCIQLPVQNMEHIEVIPESLQRLIADLFFNIIRFEHFLTTIGKEYCKYQNRQELNDLWQTIVLIYVLVFRTSVSTIEDAKNCLVFFNIYKMLTLLSYLLLPEKPTFFYITGCTIFDFNFVQEKIVDPFLKAIPFLQEINLRLRECKPKAVVAKKLTVPIQMNILKHPKKFPPTPTCTLEDLTKRDCPRSVPKTTYVTSNMEEKLALLRVEHRQQAYHLLYEANTKAPSCSQRQDLRMRKETEEKRIKVSRKNIAKSLPKFKPVSIKNNATTILRESARIANDENKELQRLKNLFQGAFNPMDIMKFEEEIKQQIKEERIRKIEKAHLTGLLTREDALIAKQRFLEDIKSRALYVRKEREVLAIKLEKWRTEQYKKIREMVEKCHDMQQASHDAYISMMDEKRQKVAEVVEESRQLKMKLCDQKEEELQRKIQLIQQIKALQTPQRLRVKDFDPTESSGLGFLCEMSLVELKERLFLVKMMSKERLQNRKNVINKERQRQKELIKSTQKMINEYKANRQATLSRTPLKRNLPEISRSPEIEALRNKLEERRNARFQKMNTNASLQ